MYRQPSTLLARSPTTCGLIAWYQYTLRQTVAEKVVDFWHMLLAVCGIYASLSSFTAEGKGREPLPLWHDIVHIMQIHSIAELNPTSKRATPEENLRVYLKQFRHDGDDVAGYLRNLKGFKKLQIAKFKELGTTHICTRTICMCHSIGLGWKSPSAFVSHMGLTNTNACAEHFYGAGEIEKELKRHKARQDARMMSDSLSGSKRQRGLQLRRAKQHKSNRYSIIHMLSVLEMVLGHETDYIYFDSMMLHCQLAEYAFSGRQKRRANTNILVAANGAALTQPSDSRFTFATPWVWLCRRECLTTMSRWLKPTHPWSRLRRYSRGWARTRGRQ